MKPFNIILLSIIMIHVGLLLVPFDPPRPPSQPTEIILRPVDISWAGMLFDQQDGLDENIVYCGTENDITP